MTDFTVGNIFTLPSKGEVYSRKINPQVTLRSMTTADEMKRLNPCERSHQMMAMVLDDCIINDIGISAYDLCIPDYQFLLHRLRLVTYGAAYQCSSVCPFCASENIHVINLDKDLSIEPFDISTFKKYSEITLPATEHKIKLRMQSPRIVDDIESQVKEFRKSSTNEFSDPAFLFRMANLIENINGKQYEDFEIVEFVRKLPMMDTNYIRKAGDKLNNFFGINPIMNLSCDACRLTYKSSFRVTAEFFAPSIDI